MPEQFEQIKVRVLRKEPTYQQVAGTGRTFHATRDCTVGKVYDAERVPKGALDYDGCVTVDDNCVTFIDDVGERVTHYLGPTLEVVDA